MVVDLPVAKTVVTWVLYVVVVVVDVTAVVLNSVDVVFVVA